MRDLLTFSRMSALLTCPYKHYLQYELGLKPVVKSAALVFGSAWHRAMEARSQKAALQEQFEAGVGTSGSLDELQVAMLSGMLCGYQACYTEDDSWIIDSEQEFFYALRRGRGAMWAAGKIDGITKPPLAAIVEHKTCSADLGADSDYWLRLRGNKQVMQYVCGARKMGYNPVCVIYDVVRKPGIRPKKTETVGQYGDRLAEDTKARPEFYFARREIPIIEQEIEAFKAERRKITKWIRWAERNECWPRAVSEMNCKICPFSAPCLQGLKITPDNIPVGFKIGEKNEELKIGRKQL